MTYEIDDKTYNVKLEKKKIKHVYIRYKNETIFINAPFLIMEREIYKLLDSNINSLRKMIMRESRKEEPLFLGEKINIVVVSNLKYPECINGKLYIKDLTKVDEAYKALAMPIFKERLDHIYSLFEEDIPYPKLKIRKMSSRWGVCNRKNNSITLNLELIKWDIIYIDYVIIHELSHFIHFNHSHDFWNLVSKYCETYKTLRKKIRE
jgi:predicted metal-dependent hydrolase